MAKVLVVDDDPRNLRLALTVLEQGGHEVLSAEGGADGVVQRMPTRYTRLCAGG